MTLTVVGNTAVVEHRFGGVTLRACLPEGWKVRNYVKNHHYIELEDDEGNTYRVMATDLIRGVCIGCKMSFYVEARYGEMCCPHCRGGVNWVWGDAKLAFVPEVGSQFKSSAPPPPKIEIVEDDEPTGEYPMPNLRPVNGTEEEDDE
jgi:hypothetical protein